MNANKIEAHTIDQIRRIGADPELQVQTFRETVRQVKAHRRGLTLEAKNLKRGIAKAKDDVKRLAGAVSRVDGAAADAIAAELADAQGQLTALEARHVEIKVELADLNAQAVDRSQLGRALEAFDPIWDVLLTPEKERVLHSLI